LLSLDPSKARTVLQVRQRFSLPETIRRTFAWYAGQAKGESARHLCETDIADWMAST
jgi:CDP-glucose 4,6-dehydratase